MILKVADALKSYSRTDPDSKARRDYFGKVFLLKVADALKSYSRTDPDSKAHRSVKYSF